MASGFVESVNYTDGSMKIQNGPTVRINDPNGVVSNPKTLFSYWYYISTIASNLLVLKHCFVVFRRQRNVASSECLGHYGVSILASRR